MDQSPAEKRTTLRERFETSRWFLFFQTALITLVFETPVGWAIWNHVLVKLFDIPRITLWQMLLVWIFVGMIFPNTYGSIFLSTLRILLRIEKRLGDSKLMIIRKED